MEVKPFEALGTLPEQPDGRASYLNAERQINLETQEQYLRYSSQILTEDGVQSAATMDIEFDPSYQQLIIHEIKVIRDGKAIDKLDPSKVRLLNRETNLESHLLDGSLTFFYPIEDIRVGDVLDYSYTIKGFHPLFQGRLFTEMAAGWSSPCSRILARIVGPADRPLVIKPLATKETLQKKDLDGGLAEWRLELRDVGAIFSEANAPAWYATYPVIRISEMKTWPEVAQWAAGLYDLDSPLTTAEQETVDQIADKNAGDEARILAALRFVQQQIRYLGIEMGHGSYRPNSGDTVLTRRFGDCKDKTQLLCRLLRGMKIDAKPALVNSEWEKGVADFPPSPRAFDHVICRVTTNGRTYWLDPTLSPQFGSLDSIESGDFGFGLVVSPDTEDLSQIKPPSGRNNKMEVKEVFTFDGMKNPVTLNVHSTFYGNDASTERVRFRNSSLAKIGQSYLDYYASSYPDIEVLEPVRFQDFPAENRFETWEKYRIQQIWVPGENKRTATFLPTLLKSAIDRPDSTRRRAPYDLGPPRRIVEEIELRMGESWNVTFSDDLVKDEFVKFSHTGRKTEDGSVILKYEYENLSDHVPAGDVGKYRQTTDKILDNLGWTFTKRDKASDPPEWKLNWVMVVVWFFAALIGMAISVALILYRPQASPPPLPDPTAPKGLGGWLILVQLGIWLRLFQQAVLLKLLAGQFDLNSWSVLTFPGAESYHAFWAPTLIFESFATIVLFFVQIAALVLMYQKRRTFPLLLIGILISFAVAGAVDAAISFPLPGIDHDAGDFVKILVACAIWIPYLNESRRVRATFVRR